MKKFYGFYTTLFTMMILIITASGGASFTGDGKGVYEGDRQPGIQANDPLVKSSSTIRDLEAVPEGLTKTDWEKIRASIERDRYRLHKDDRTGVYQVPNYAHDLHATFTREGFQVSPRKEGKAWIWGLSLRRYGYGSHLHAVTGAEKMTTQDNRIEYHRGDMVEWYINDQRGLEQGFTLKARPSARMGSGLLQLQMRTTGNLIPAVEKDGKGIVWRDAHGKEALRYSGLYAYDAAGKELGARMDTDQQGIRLIVEDHEAVYPITIDPFIERKKLLPSDGEVGDYFGFSVSISGDTAIVGADHNDDNGSAYIFSRNQGGEDNWGQVNKLTSSDGAVGDYFGLSVSISGDTAIVGAFGDDDNGEGSGSAYIFSRNQGGEDNWGQANKLTASDGAEDDYFGFSVSINGDTAIVGAHWDDDNGSSSGSAYVYKATIGGYMVTSDLWIRAVIATEEKGPIEAMWKKGGEDITARGDTVIWGHFYASPDDVTWGSSNNPDLFVKIWFDVSGRIDVNFFHVSVPDIEVYSDYPYDGTADEQGTTTMNTRYIRQYYENSQSYSEENYEDGVPPAGYSSTGNPSGYSTINDLRIGSIINTVEKGPIDAVWRLGGQDTTSRGDQVVWGHFYASPSDVTWGSQDNPDLFVKIWFDESGRVDVNFFHVSVPDIEVYSDLPDDSSYDQKGTTIMDNRYIRHEYWR